MKKIVSRILLLCLFLQLFSLCACNSSPFTYLENEDGTICILGYRGENTDIVIPDKIDGKTVTAINAPAFTQDEITSIVLPDSVKTIGEDAFSSCEALVSVTLPAGLTSIGKEAFYNCKSLQEIHFPYGLTEIGENAFLNCVSLSSVSIPATVSKIGPAAFARCYNLDKLEVHGNNEHYKSIDNNLISSGGVLVAAYGSADIPDGITEIGNSAFYSRDDLTNIAIPDGVAVIGDHAFADCDNLEQVILPTSVRLLDDFAFFNCVKLTSVEFSEGLQQIHWAAFASCSAIKNLDLPSTLTVIEKRAFEHLNNVERITVAEGNIAYYAQGNCLITTDGKLIFGCKNSVIPEGVRVIGEYAFWDCRDLKAITLPDSLTTIESFAFTGTRIQSIHIPKKVTGIKHYPFTECPLLKEITVDPDNPVYTAENNCLLLGDELILGCSTSIIPDYVKTIGTGAFISCTGLIEMAIPDSVTLIHQDAFRNCTNLKRLYIPDSVTTMAVAPFYECPNLVVYCEFSEPPSGWSKQWNENGSEVVWNYTNE